MEEIVDLAGVRYSLHTDATRDGSYPAHAL